MRHDEGGSVTRWIGDLRRGGDAAAQPLWDRYFTRLVRLAHQGLLKARRSGDVLDSEDVAVSAFATFCRGAAAGRFPRLADRNDLSRLLYVITLNKAAEHLRREHADKRGGQWARLAPGADGDPLDAIADSEPSPELAAIFAEEYQRLRSALPKESLRKVLDMRLSGYTTEEIAEHLGCVKRTVSRKLETIREVMLGGEG